MDWKCPKCGGEQEHELLPSKTEGRWKLKYECKNCHLRSWTMLDEGEKAPESASKGMMFSRNKALKCEICEQYTDILHPHHIEGDGDYLMCGTCKQTFSEAEGMSRFNSSFL